MTKTNGAKKNGSTLPKTHAKLAKVIGDNLSTRRIDSGLTQEALAAKLKVTPLYVSAMENGRRLPSLSLLCEIATALNTGLDALVAAPKPN